MKKLFVGQLSFSTSEEALQALFAEFGQIQSIKIITDAMTGRSRGFGFVELVDDAAADAAISALNGKNVDGRDITVSEARPQGERTGGGGGGSRGGSRGGFSRDRSSGGGGGSSYGNRSGGGGGNKRNGSGDYRY